MPDYKKLARQAAGEVGVDPRVFTSLVRHESGFNPRARSPAGAEGLTQLMPGTAHGLATKYGINPSTPYGNLLGGAYYLKEQLDNFGDMRKALAAYNAGPGAVHQYNGVPPYAETQRYVRNVLASAGVSKYNSKLGAPANPALSYARQSLDNSGLKAALLENLAQIGMQGGHVDALAGLGNIAGGIAQDRVSNSTLGAGFTRVPSSLSSSSKGGSVSVSPTANRAGAKLSPEVLAFVRQIAAFTGKLLTIGTGTNHNQYVVGTHRQSAHWTGRAADIPASGAELTRLGRAALVAAGMSPEKAQKQTGGLFNIGGYQVIFNSRIGGNHFNHLHVGLRG
jgi:hypothetical protein